jgi:uncharacterized protein involved in exopolysaccharide biosynthesis
VPPQHGGKGVNAGDYGQAQDLDTFDVRGSLRGAINAARANRRLVLVTTALTLAIVTAYVLVWPPIYKVEATLMAEREFDQARDSFYTGWNVFRKDDARTEVELMTAGPVLAEVIRRENLTYDDVYHPFLSHVAHLWSKSWLGRGYRWVKALAFPREEDAPSEQDLEMGKIVNDMRAGISIEPIADSNVAKLKVKGPNRKVTRIANALLDVYLAHRNATHRDEAQRSLSILQAQVGAARDELRVLTDRRLAFLQENQLAFDLQKEGLEVVKLAELETNISTSRTRIASLEASLREVNRQLRREPAVRTTTKVYEVNAVREATKMKRMELQTALIRARSHYREDSPDVQDILAELAKLDTLIAGASERVEKGTTEGLNSVQQQLASSRNALRSDLHGTRAALAVMERTAAQLRDRLAAVPAMQTTLRAVDRDIASASDKYQLLLGKQAQASVSLATTQAAMPSVRVVEYAVSPDQKWWPRLKILYPAAALLGLLLGWVAAIARSYGGGRVLREHVARGRGWLPLYGTIAVPARGRVLALAVKNTEEPVALREYEIVDGGPSSDERK